MVRWRMSGGSFLILVFAVPLAVGQGETCSIEGSVTAAESGTPLARAEITIYRNGASDVPEAVTSDASGHYVVDDLEPGRYSLVAQRNGYLPQTYGQRRRNREGIALILEPGKKLQGVDFKLIATGVIVGRALGEDNESRVGATVQAFTSGYVRGRRRLLAAGLANTNDLGEYRIYGLAPGQYYVSVLGQEPHQTYTQPKGAPPEEQYVSTFYPNVSEFEYATVIDVVPGGETRAIDIVALKRRTFHVRGRILGFDSTDHYTRVKAEAVEPANAVFRGADIAPDAQGNFDFGGVTPGSYLISTTLVQKESFKSALRLIQVGEADVNDISLAPSSGINLQGRVRVEGDKRIDPSKLQVDLSDPDSPISLPIPVNSDGTFSIQGARQYVYQIGISRLPEDFYLKSVRLGDQEIAGTSIDLGGAQGPPGALEILISGSGGRIDGMVKNEKDEPASGGSVVLVPDPSHRQENSLFKYTTTDENGRFTISGIRPGEYKLFAWDDIEPGAWQDPELLLRYEDKGEEVSIEANGHVSRDLISIKPE